jgi:pimeloyl-ACP methyl ester carboxylesterase
VHRRLGILAIFALILPAPSGSPQVGAGEPKSSRRSNELAWATRAGGLVVDRREPRSASEIHFESRGLCLLRPYTPEKVPVVFVDGLWGRPQQWSQMIRALEADPFVSERFQFLTFGYSTGDPIPYSALLLRRELRTLRDRLDPNHADPSWDRIVLIGHSMGGLLCKMMSQDSGTKLRELMTCRPLEKLAGPVETRELLQAAMVYKPVPEVRRVIFVATPHRGSPLVWGPIREVGIRLVRPAAALRQARESLLAANGSDVFRPRFRAGLPTSIDELAWEHPLLLAIDGLPIDPNVKRHSIIADLCSTSHPGGGDGLVPYASAHHPGATSELLINAGHYCLEIPGVIGEVARILKEHATP